MTLENIVYACYEDGKIWHYRPVDENTIEWW